MKTALRLLDRFLPHPEAPNPSASDQSPHPALSALLLTSNLLELLQRLLRNDSFEDICANKGRSDLYFAALSVIQTLSACESTLDLLIAPRHCKKTSPGLTAWLFDTIQIEWEIQSDVKGKGKKRAASDQTEMTEPLMRVFDNLVRQATFLQTAVKDRRGNQSDA